MKKIIFILALPFSYCLTAQNNCSCDLYNITKTTNSNNLKVAETLIQSNSISCNANGHFLMGSLFLERKKIDSAEYYLLKAEKNFKEINCNDSSLLYTYKKLSRLYYIKSDFPKTQDYSLKMLRCAEIAKNVFEEANGLIMIAQIFNQTNQAEKGIVFTRRAMKLLNKIEKTNEKLDILFTLSKRYLWHYQDTKLLSSLDSSFLLSSLQIELAKKTKNLSSLARAYNNLQGVEYERGHFKKALVYIDSSFAFTDKTNFADLRVNYFDKADLFIEMNQLNEAKKMADSSLYFSKLYGQEIYTAENYEQISLIEKKRGNYQEAFEFSEMARTITDSIRNVEKVEAVTELEKKYNQVKNESTIKELANKKQLYLFVAISALLATFTIGLFFLFQSLKHKKQILETEQRLNRARMNPHFFFNALTALQKFSMGNNSGQAMASHLAKFSNIMRETLESTYKEYITIEQEIDFLSEYLEVQKIRFPETFSYEVSADKNLEIDELQIPAMIIQPFVENSIEHGFVGVEYGGKIIIRFKKEHQELLIQIEDNGKGLSSSTKEQNDHISRASQIIKDRLYLLNLKLKTKSRFSLENNTKGPGVTVKIYLPYLFKDQKTT